MSGFTEQVLECLCGFATRSYAQECRSKYVIDTDETVTVECCFQLLTNLQIEHPVGQILLDCVSTFHNEYGCSVRTLLCMILVFYRLQLRLDRQDIPSVEIGNSLDRILNICISYLEEVATDIEPLLRSTCSQAENIVTPAAFAAEHTISSTHNNFATSCQPIIIRSKVEKENTDDFEELSWYFTPDAPSLDLAPINDLHKHVTKVKPLLPQSSHSSRGSTSRPVYTHSDDEDFDGCIDTVAQSVSSPKKVNNVNNLDWLNKALASIAAKGKPTCVDDHHSLTRDTKPNSYSRNMSCDNNDPHGMLAEKAENRLLKSSTPNSNKNLKAKELPPLNDAQHSSVNKTDRKLLGTSHIAKNFYVKTEAVIKKESNNGIADRQLELDLDRSGKTPDPPLDSAECLGHHTKPTLAPSPSTRQSVQSLTSIESLVSGITRSDDVMSLLLLRVVRYITSERGELSFHDLDSVNHVRCVGPLEGMSDVHSGLIAECDWEAFALISGKGSFKSLLFQGDLHPDYTHTGYKNSVKCRNVLRPKEFFLESKATDWCEETLQYLIQNGVECVLIKGRCHAVLKDNLAAAGVLVLEKVNYSVLTFLSEQAAIPILHYAADINEKYSCNLQITQLNLHAYNKQRNYFANINFSAEQKCPIAQKSMLTVVLCSPIAEQTHIMEERFRHALERLKRILLSKRCLVGLSLNNMIHQLYSCQDIWSTDGVLSTATEYFIDELHCLATLSRCDPAAAPHIDDVESVAAAWESALSTVKYLSSMSIVVRTGMVKREDW